MGIIYVIGTCDTKEAELLFAKGEVERCGVAAALVDVSTRGGPSRADFTIAPSGSDDRGLAVAAMAATLTEWLLARDDVAGVLGLGGSGNTAIVTAAMRVLPIGLPKLMVSTTASGNVAPYVGASDIAMMYSVTDVAGLNAISRQIIGNAAHAIAGMVRDRLPAENADKPGVGLTMFGVTTPCVTQIREIIEKTHECYVFAATGTGGRAMEKLVDSQLLQAVIDITTTEVADYLVGGTLACNEDRFGAIIRTRIPYVASVGATDMVNFGARDTVPAKFEGRRFYIHNPQVTLMRATPAEAKAIGEWIVARLNQMEGPVRFLLPLRGVSAIDAEGKPFHDQQADAALFDAIRYNWIAAPNRSLIEIDAHINDLEFTAEVVRQFTPLLQHRSGTRG